MSILHFRKELFAPPVTSMVPGVAIRQFDKSTDIGAWLRLRERATVALEPAVRRWREADFRAEMLGKSWWRAERCWIASAGASSHESPNIIGSVTLAVREGEFSVVPIVHWLLVDPGQRRRGIARWLIFHLEQAAWNAGWREVQLETHAGWSSAVAFYQSIGYARVLDRSPR